MTDTPILDEEDTGNCDSEEFIKYGELTVLGYNGSLAKGNRGRKRSKFVLHKRQEPNGVQRLLYEIKQSDSPSPLVTDTNIRTISYIVSETESVTVGYGTDENTDMFQIGRAPETCIDFVVLDTKQVQKGNDNIVRYQDSMISRFACRILAERNNLKIARIYAAAFDTSQKIFLGQKGLIWQDEGNEMDGLTTNGVQIMHPKGSFYGGEINNGVWVEVSVRGVIYTARQPRTARCKGQLREGESNVLQDGTLINLCGVTLLWRSAEGLAKSPSKQDLECELDDLHFTKPHPVAPNTLKDTRKREMTVTLNTLENPPKRKVKPNENQKQLYVYLNCGHVQDKDSGDEKCPICLKVAPAVKICMGLEPAFYVDSGPPTYAFNPCGHMATEKTIKYWATVPIPCGLNDYQAACPFCASFLCGYPGYIKLIF